MGSEMCIRDRPEVGEEHTIQLEAEPDDWVDHDEAPVRSVRLRVQEVDRHVPSVLAIELVEDYPDQSDDDDEKEDA